MMRWAYKERIHDVGWSQTISPTGQRNQRHGTVWRNFLTTVTLNFECFMAWSSLIHSKRVLFFYEVLLLNILALNTTWYSWQYELMSWGRKDVLRKNLLTKESEWLVGKKRLEVVLSVVKFLVKRDGLKSCVLERKVAFERRVEKLLLSERVLESSKGEEERKTGLNHSLLRLEVWSVVPAPDPDPAPIQEPSRTPPFLPSRSLSLLALFPPRSLSFLALFNRVASAWTLEP